MTVDTKPASDHRPQIVHAAGAATTLAAFALVFALAKSGENIMGWYANWILPVGAVLVGCVAASGYAIAAWLTGLKMTTRMAWSVVGQLTLSYFIAQYEAFQLHVPSGSSLGFWEYFDYMTRAFSFSSRNGKPGDPLGAVGYVFRVIEIAGFVGGGVIVPLALRGKPYCDPCRTYKRTSTISVIPGGLQPPEMADGPYADRGQQSALLIVKAAARSDRADAQRLIGERGPLANARATRKLPTFTTVTLSRCPRCAQGDLAATVTEHQGGNNWRIVNLGGVAMSGETTRNVFD